MKLKKVLKSVTLHRLLAVLIVLGTLNGCARVTVYPITNTDIWSVSKGDKILTQDGEVLITKNGWVLSDFYLKHVAEAKVK